MPVGRLTRDAVREMKHKEGRGGQGRGGEEEKGEGRRREVRKDGMRKKQINVKVPAPFGPRWICAHVDD